LGFIALLFKSFMKGYFIGMACGKLHHPKKLAYSIENKIEIVSTQLVCPVPSIDYPGTRVFDGFCQYSSTPVIGLSRRVFKFMLFFNIYQA
jgi:hypothetical protein